MSNFAFWGNIGNQAFAVPLVQLTPTLPLTQGYVLAWDTVNQAVGYMPMSFDPATGDATLTGNFGLAVGKVFKVNGTQVVAARDTGWSAMTGAANKNTVYDTATITLAQLAGRVMSIQAALTAHGLLGI